MNSELKVFSGSSNIPLAQKICDYLSIQLGSATTKKFNDGEIFVRFNENIRERDIFIVQSIGPPVNDNLVETLLLLDAARRASAARITLVAPYLGYQRQDRKNEPRVSISSRLIADLIEKAGADRVVTVDLHNSSNQGNYKIAVDNLFASSLFIDYIKPVKPTVISPDVGGTKIAEKVSSILGSDFGFVTKKRKNDIEVSPLHVVGDIEGKDVLIIDDITSSCSTLFQAAQVLKQYGAKTVKASISHFIPTDKSEEKLKENKYIDELILTDTIQHDKEKLNWVTKLSVGDILGETIKRINNSESVSGLFNINGV